MNIYYVKALAGHYLPGIAVAVADTPEIAACLINVALAKEGLQPSAAPEIMHVLDTAKPQAVILFNGDY